MTSSAAVWSRCRCRGLLMSSFAEQTESQEKGGNHQPLEASIQWDTHRFPRQLMLGGCLCFVYASSSVYALVFLEARWLASVF